MGNISTNQGDRVLMVECTILIIIGEFMVSNNWDYVVLLGENMGLIRGPFWIVHATNPLIQEYMVLIGEFKVLIKKFMVPIGNTKSEIRNTTKYFKTKVVTLPRLITMQQSLN